MGQDKFRRKSGGVQATQYDPRGSTAIVYRNTVQCSPKFTAIIVASTNSCTVPAPGYRSSAPARHSCMTCLSCVHSHNVQPWTSSTRIEPKDAKFRTRSNNSKVQGPGRQYDD